MPNTALSPLADLDITEALAPADIEWAHQHISQSYWASGMPRQTFARAVANSLCFVARRKGVPIGFARVVTDRASFAYLCDVIVHDAHRGQGVGKALVTHLLAHPDLQGLRRICLMTRDAHTLYTRFGFEPMPDPTRYLQRHNPHVYDKAMD
jgi:GNAT superfamily N-acetyltransferase